MLVYSLLKLFPRTSAPIFESTKSMELHIVQNISTTKNHCFNSNYVRRTHVEFNVSNNIQAL